MSRFAHVANERVLVDAHGSELIHDASDAVVDAAQGFGVALVVLLDVEFGVIGEVDAVPAVALVA